MPKEKKEEKEKEEQAKSEVSKEVAKIVEAISELTVLQLSELTKAIEEKFGVSAAVPMVAASAPAEAAQEQQEKSEGKDSFKVILKSDGGSKIPVIKALREVRPDLGLKEAKELVDAAPSPVKEDVEKQEAEEIKKKLEEAGAEVELE
ncbi:50S ribosomal protein L7/L12 [candidate division CPR3 bacterium 4484_211]|uniref:Large ribosomal subunit protein bL12 n=1 Tax=candidate division CPR3 bacterium 4484_211 TaxID=1968527 RepID=A0A1W9NXM8_UNCC3|nr:MAG: 50S ribosomal protein L7/L12 [candidate division CPR3 bacterium 4484_211]